MVRFRAKPERRTTFPLLARAKRARELPIKKAIPTLVSNCQNSLVVSFK
ncbi:MAG: hypothetical protein U5L45_23475 [Saprospiraceae bacterium]|nr:hypothetical protein [Saprospiraceae bacterium]